MSAKKVCEICGMVAVVTITDKQGREHYYCEHHDLRDNASALQYTREIKTKPKDYFIFIGLIIGIIVVAGVYQQYFGLLGAKAYMRAFMGVFFLVFSFFKLLNLQAFMMSYTGYDLIAKRWPSYGYLYPFIELALGLAFLLNFQTTSAYFIDVIIMTIGSIGVTQQLLRGSKIRCACLGELIQLPLTTISLTEDVVMLSMGVLSLVL